MAGLALGLRLGLQRAASLLVAALSVFATGIWNDAAAWSDTDTWKDNA